MADWYYSSGGQQLGPVSGEQLQKLARAGQLQTTDLVWKDGMADWKAAGSIDGLLGAATAPAPFQPMAPAAVGYPSADPNAGYAQPLAYQAPAQEGLVATSRSLDMLKRTKPWVRFISVMTFIACGLMLIGGVIGAIGTSMGGRSSGPNAAAATGQMFAMIALSAIYLVPAIFMGRFASRIGDLMRLRRATDLEAALEAQKSVWKCFGIIMIVILCLYGLIILGALLFAVSRF